MLRNNNQQVVSGREEVLLEGCTKSPLLFTLEGQTGMLRIDVGVRIGWWLILFKVRGKLDSTGDEGGRCTPLFSLWICFKNAFVSWSDSMHRNRKWPRRKKILQSNHMKIGWTEYFEILMLNKVQMRTSSSVCLLWLPGCDSLGSQRMTPDIWPQFRNWTWDLLQMKLDLFPSDMAPPEHNYSNTISERALPYNESDHCYNYLLHSLTHWQLLSKVLK